MEQFMPAREILLPAALCAIYGLELKVATGTGKTKDVTPNLAKQRRQYGELLAQEEARQTED